MAGRWETPALLGPDRSLNATPIRTALTCVALCPPCLVLIREDLVGAMA